MPNAKPPRPSARVSTHSRFLLVGAVLEHQQQAHVVADDRVLVLQIVVQAESFAREVFSDDGHAEVGAVPTAVLLGERIAVVAGGVGALARLEQQRLPLLVRQSATLPIGARVLTTVIEEPDVVIGFLERDDLAFDERIQLCEVGDQVGRQREVHRRSVAAGGGICRGVPGSGPTLAGRQQR